MINRLEQEIKKTTFRFVLTSLILLLAAVALSVVWNRSIKDELAIQASSFVRKGISTKEMRGVVEYLNGVQFSAFRHVSLMSPNDEHIITLPPVFDRRTSSQDLMSQILYSSVTIPIFLDTESKSLAAKATYTYSRFELVPYAVLIWLFSAMMLALVFHQAKKKVEIEFEKEVRVKNAELTEEIAKKVRHNIRSPLASLRAIFIEKMFSPEMIFDQGIGVIKRLEEIIEELKPRNPDNTSINSDASKQNTKAIFDVAQMLKAIVAEKKLISKNVEIDLTILNSESSYGIYTFISTAHFLPMLSNIIDNSLQAIKIGGEINITLSYDEESFSIEVKDTGHGIEKEHLTKVFDKHFTHGKIDGSGLGLFYAKKLVESNLGNIEITSDYGKGTSLSFILPRAKTPSWHIDRISLGKYQLITLCDDQQTMIDAWEVKFRGLSKSPEIESFRSCESMEKYIDLANSRLYLVDFDLGEGKMTGLDFLARHPSLSKNFVLVTGHYDEPWIQDACQRLDCKLLSKDSIFQLELN
ncbi:MAG: hypothetical protein B7Y39_04155 [Bdellovibrio sp. 28-41-41]|nr:MAG: hypothetical protein B7Y39_04155 [Bdellovibrio sp. 28-41-41]